MIPALHCLYHFGVFSTELSAQSSMPSRLLWYKNSYEKVNTLLYNAEPEREEPEKSGLSGEFVPHNIITISSSCLNHTAFKLQFMHTN